MATQYEPIVKDSTLNTTEPTPRNLADVLAEGLDDLANAVKPDASDIDLAPISGMSANNVQSGISELKGTLISKDVAAPFAEQPTLTLDNCTGTLTSELFYKVVGNMLAIYGRFRIANITRTSSGPGVKLSLPSGYQITTPSTANHPIYVGSSFYSDSARNGESTYIQLANGSHDYFYIRASESFANIINNKTIMYIVPYTLLKLSST